MDRHSTRDKKILFIAANPRDMPFLRLDEEFKIIKHYFKCALKVDFRLDSLQDVLDLPLNDLINIKFFPDIIHFSSHGDQEGLISQNENDNSEHTPIGILLRNLRPFRNRFKCIVINACSSTSLTENISKDHSCVIGWSHSFPDEAALAFTRGFYSNLSKGKRYGESFNKGCIQIMNEKIPAENLPIIKIKGKAKNIEGEITDLMNEIHDKCRYRDVPFRSPHLFNALLNSDYNNTIKRKFNLIKPAMYDELNQVVIEYVESHEIKRDGRSFTEFDWHVLEEIEAANIEAIRENAKEITARHITIGILLSDNKVAAKVKKTLNPIEFNSLIGSLRNFILEPGTSEL